MTLPGCGGRTGHVAFHSCVTAPAGWRGILKAHPHLPRDARSPAGTVCTDTIHPSLCCRMSGAANASRATWVTGSSAWRRPCPPQTGAWKTTGSAIGRPPALTCTSMVSVQPCRARGDGPWTGTFLILHLWPAELPSGELEGGMAKGTGTHLCSLMWFSPFPYVSCGEVSHPCLLPCDVRWPLVAVAPL